MKEIELTNYSTMFPGVFHVYVTAKKIDKKTYREVFFKCQTCGERARQEIRAEPIQEMILECLCRGNHTFGLDTWTEIAADANKIPMKDLED